MTDKEIQKQEKEREIEEYRPCDVCGDPRFSCSCVLHTCYVCGDDQLEYNMWQGNNADSWYCKWCEPVIDEEEEEED